MYDLLPKEQIRRLRKKIRAAEKKRAEIHTKIRAAEKQKSGPIFTPKFPQNSF